MSDLRDCMKSGDGCPDRIGYYCEALFEAACLYMNIPIARPVVPVSKIDRLIKMDGKWLAVQIKTARTPNNLAVSCQLAAGGGKKYTELDDLDLFAAILPETGTIWLIPAKECMKKSSISCAGRIPWMPGIGLVSQNIPFNTIVPPVVDKTDGEWKYRGTKPQRVCKVVKYLSQLDTSTKPEDVSESSWNMAQGVLAGRSVRDVARENGISPPAVVDRLQRVSWHLDGTYASRPSGSSRKRRTALSAPIQNRMRTILQDLKINDRYRPKTIKESTWDMANMLANGMSLQDIGTKYGVHENSSRARIRLVIEKLGGPYRATDLILEAV